MYTLLYHTEFSSLQERTVSGCVTVWGTTGTALRVPWGSPRTGHCWGWGSPPPSPCGTRTQTSSDTASWLSPTHQTSSKYPLTGKHTFSLLKGLSGKAVFDRMQHLFGHNVKMKLLWALLGQLDKSEARLAERMLASTCKHMYEREFLRALNMPLNSPSLY